MEMRAGSGRIITWSREGPSFSPLGDTDGRGGAMQEQARSRRGADEEQTRSCGVPEFLATHVGR